jgi:hypothetical protein
VTEIPEHLLKRSKERRAALTGEPVGGDSSAAATPATTESAAPTAAASVPAKAAPAKAAAAPAAPPPPKPDIPVVAAAKARRRIPYWAMAGLSILPLWGFMYARSLTPAPVVATGPLAEGATVYAACESCHGSAGDGGSGRVLSGGEVLLTFPRIEDQINFVYWGTQGYEAAGITVYGDPNREGGPHAPRSFNGSIMPAQGLDAGGALTDAQLLAVVCHERYDLSGGDQASAEFTEWCAPDSELFIGLEDGALTFASEVFVDVGTEPRPSLGGQAEPGPTDQGGTPSDGGG